MDRGDEEDDAVLLNRWRSGDRSAGQVLFGRHFEAVRRYFVNKVADDPEALMQDTFLACVESVHRFEGRSSFRVYLLGIARNLLRHHWERRRVRGRNEAIDDMSIADLGAGPSTIMSRIHQAQRLIDALRRVTLADQEILELHFFEDLTGPQMATLLGLSEDGARSRLRRAKLNLGKEYRRLERFAGAPESSDDDIEAWAAAVRAQLRDSQPEPEPAG